MKKSETIWSWHIIYSDFSIDTILCVIILAFVLLLSLSSAIGFAISLMILGICFGGVMGFIRHL